MRERERERDNRIIALCVLVCEIFISGTCTSESKREMACWGRSRKSEYGVRHEKRKRERERDRESNEKDSLVNGRFNVSKLKTS